MASMADVLSRYGVRFQHKTQIYLPCPLPSHTSKHSSNSLSVNLERNIWARKSEFCIAGRNGKEGGNVLHFAMWMERCDLKSIAATILEWFGAKQTADFVSVPKADVNKPEPDHTLVDWLEQKTRQ